jgi:pimeloyl-ACP methyl ester carboxylesterase
MSAVPITEHVAKTARHTTFFLAAGPADGPLIVFLHGWPELSHSWRAQLACLGGLGFRAVAPDLRGYGRSSVYATHDAYAQEQIIADMLELLQSLGAGQAVWVGHDWGSPVAWNLASHHPEHCRAVASLCLPYYTLERGLAAALPLINRRIYPEAEYPFGQWDYIAHYQENFAAATSAFDADPDAVIKLLFRKGNPAGQGKPAMTAAVRRNGGWFPGGTVPDVPRDADVISEEDLSVYAAALRRNGFFGPDAFYMNDQANAAYADRAVNGGFLDMPALFLAAQYDYVADCTTSRLAEPMRSYCRDLTVRLIPSGHWMEREKPREVNAALVHWLVTGVPGFWPK